MSYHAWWLQTWSGYCLFLLQVISLVVFEVETLGQPTWKSSYLQHCTNYTKYWGKVIHAVEWQMLSFQSFSRFSNAPTFYLPALVSSGCIAHCILSPLEWDSAMICRWEAKPACPPSGMLSLHTVGHFVPSPCNFLGKLCIYWVSTLPCFSCASITHRLASHHVLCLLLIYYFPTFTCKWEWSEGLRQLYFLKVHPYGQYFAICMVGNKSLSPKVLLLPANPLLLCSFFADSLTTSLFLRPCQFCPRTHE